MLYTVTKVTNLETVKIEFRHLSFLLSSSFFMFYFCFHFKKKCEIAIMLMNEGVSDLKDSK